MDIDLSRIKIRRVELNGVKVLTDYRLQYLTEMQGEKSLAYKEKLRGELELFFTNSMNEGSFFAVVAEYEENALAFGGMVIRKIPGDFSRPTYKEADILNMYTIPEARRKGISSLILKNLLIEAQQLGITKVSLHTSKDGEQLYRKFGFKDPVFPVLELDIKQN
ncbi:MAG TPA: GNAT family N-acetyltransferase [Bacteroidales bacterium]|nr:GNAT family N-acetyltransferase [Bacteroidales bacterium]